jgi:hypothetical protein
LTARPAEGGQSGRGRLTFWRLHQPDVLVYCELLIHFRHGGSAIALWRLRFSLGVEQRAKEKPAYWPQQRLSHGWSRRGRRSVKVSNGAKRPSDPTTS